MKAPLAGQSSSPVDGGVPPVSSTASALPGESFVDGVIKFCENTFRLVGFFIYTCLAYGILAATCHQNPFLWLFVFFLGFLFWLYFWTVTFGLLGFIWARRRKTEKWRQWGGRVVKVMIFVLAVLSFVFLSFSDLIDTYVLRLFPEAQQCDMYGGNVPKQPMAPKTQ